MVIIRRFLALILVFAVAAAISLPAVAGEDNDMKYFETKTFYKNILEKEIKYLKKLQFQNGAIGMYEPGADAFAGFILPEVEGISPEEYTKWPSASVNPYFTDSAVMGIIKGCEVLGITDGRETVLDFINWYISHMNTKTSDLNGVAGTVYDYFIFQSDDGRIVEVTHHDAYASQYPANNPHDYDSTDSYAAMFLEILYEYTRVFDNEFLDDKKEIVDTLVDVIMATYVPAIDLTYAKPNYAVVYLMDNCEVFRGFEAAAKIYGEYIKDKEKEEFCKTHSQKVKNALLTTMWAEEYSCFKAAVFTDGKPAGELDLTNFYPQASCQLFPIIFGIIEPTDEKAVTVYERFRQDFIQEGVKGRDWSLFDLEGLTYPWCILAYTSAVMGDFRSVKKHIRTMNSLYISKNHGYPYYNGEIGWVMIVTAYMYEYVSEFEEESSEEIPSEETSETLSRTSQAESSVPQAKDGKGLSPWIYAGIGVGIGAALAVTAYLIGKNKRKKG